METVPVEIEKTTPVELIGRECRFVTHLKAVDRLREDTHVVSEVLHYSDGTTKPNIRILTNFKRTFYVTKEHFRIHKDKKETEDIKKLNIHYSTQSELANSIAARIGKVGYRRNRMSDILDNPYVYGHEITSSALLKKMYMKKYPDLVTPYALCVLDIEVDIALDIILVVTVAMKDKIYTAINSRMLKGITDPIQKIRALYDKHVPDTALKKNVDIEICIFDKEVDLIKTAFVKVHEWKPAFLAIWNIEYDLPKIVSRLEKFHVDPAYIFSDPDIPNNLKYFKYIQGMKQRVTESGVVKPINIQEQWHVAEVPASFYFIDAMCAYSQVRTGQAGIPGGYGLDNVLNKELALGKLSFGDDPKYKGADWHNYMVANKPLEYIVYNQWDNMGMLELDAKTKDLSHILPMLAGASDFSRFNSGPKKIVDALYFYFLDMGRVIGGKPKTTSDDKILGLDNWIVTLPAFRLVDNGLCLIEEDGKLHTNVRGHVYDLDAVSSYPSNIQAANVSKATTRKEIVDVIGIEKDTFKKQNMNLLSGSVNSISYCVTMFGFPTLSELGELIEK